jgi:hypothetical protein
LCLLRCPSGGPVDASNLVAFVLVGDNAAQQKVPPIVGRYFRVA